MSAPYGPLALSGTHWIEDYPEGLLPDMPGRWSVDGDAVVLTADAADGLLVDGEPFAGEVRLGADPGPAATARVAHGERRFVVLVREGALGVRDFDPASPARQAFRGIEATRVRPALVGAGSLHAVRGGPDRTRGERRRTGARARARR